MRDGERPLSPRTAGLVELARDSLGQMTEERRVAGLEAVRARLSARRRVWRARRSGLAATGVLALASCIVLAASWAHHRVEQGSTLVLRVEGAELGADGVVEASGSGRPVLRFSDGSAIELAERTRARVRSVDDHGARVLLERGEARISVAHEPGARWTFDAGPFVVAVTGTAFTLSWRDDLRRLDVRLEMGTVTVSGPASDAPLTLRAGQWLTSQGGDVRIRSLGTVDDPEAGAP